MSRWQQFAQNRIALLGLAVLAGIMFCAVFAPWLVPQSPYDLASLDLHDSRLPPGTSGQALSLYFLGSDVLGRDLLSAILYGLRMSLLVGLASGVFAFAVGTCVGLMAAWKGGRIESALMRLVDLQLSFPSILVALILLAILGKGLDKIIFALVLVQWAPFARTARATALGEVGREYIEAARTLQLPAWRIVLRHLLPNCLPPLTVILTVQVAAAISLEATLSFLGVGLPITEPSLGLLIASGFQFLLSGDYWISLFPGVALVLLVGSINLVGDQLRLVFNPRLRPQPRLRYAPQRETLANATAPDDASVALQVQGLRTHFFTPRGTVRSVDGIDLQLSRGEILGVVGESGSGKSITGRSLMGLVAEPGRIVSGHAWLDGEDLLGLPEARLRRLRGDRIAMIFQDPMMTLNPVLRIETQMVEAIRAHHEVSHAEARTRAIEALARVGIPAPEARLRAWPHQLSGGMRQRVAIAIAFLNQPRVVIADEPTTALDVTIQGQILAEARELAKSTGTAMIWITHDLGVVAGLADRIAVMYMGRIVESGPTADVLASPTHPYTRGLLDALPSGKHGRTPLQPIPGQAPSPLELDTGCAFRARCTRVSDTCAVMPSMRALSQTREVRCHHPLGQPT